MGPGGGGVRTPRAACNRYSGFENKMAWHVKSTKKICMLPFYKHMYIDVCIRIKHSKKLMGKTVFYRDPNQLPEPASCAHTTRITIQWFKT